MLLQFPRNLQPVIVPMGTAEWYSQFSSMMLARCLKMKKSGRREKWKNGDGNDE